MKASFPLASLALLISVFASLMACADADRWRQQYTWLSLEWPWRIVAVFGSAALFGLIVGGVAMCFTKTNWRTRLLAPLAGLVAGEISAVILIAPGPMWRTVFAVAVLLTTALLFRAGAD